jgi:propanol-preferring alcohol dehydrogenase
MLVRPPAPLDVVMLAGQSGLDDRMEIAMRAFRLVAPNTTELTTVPQPEPGPGEVLVRVGAAGACHSDLHIIEAPAGAFPLPMTLGHEIAGWVEALGPGVDGWRQGQPVAIYGIMGCGSCFACLRGHDNECRTVPPGGIGLSRDGGMAEYVVVPARQLLPVGDLDVAQAATLTDAGLTPYHAIELARDVLRPGATCVAIGVGGLGHLAVQILAATTAARVIAVDRNDDALELAGRIGAHHTLKSDAGAATFIRELVGPAPGGAEAVFDFVGADETLALGASVVSTGGRLILVGLAGGRLAVRPGLGPMGIPMETRLVISFWGTRAELAEVIALARAGRITPHVERYRLDDARTAYDRLHHGQLRGRAVIIPGAAADREAAHEEHATTARAADRERSASSIVRSGRMT